MTISLFTAQRRFQSNFPGWRPEFAWNLPCNYLHWIEEAAAYYGSLPFDAIANHPYFGAKGE